MQEFDLSFDLQLYPEQMREAAEFLREHPQTPVVIDHAGSPYDQTEAGLKEWATGIKMLSQLDNTHVKISGFGMYNRDWNYQNTEIIFQKIYETFGAKRMMWGSNFPVDRLMQSYGHCTSQLKQWLRDLEREEQEDICWRTAAKFYRLEIGTANG